MALKMSAPRKRAGASPDQAKLDQVVAQTLKERDARMQGYREQALKLYPWICTRCGREFKRDNVYELTVHHRDHDHDNNPPDGSNWELLCTYCHENEHARYVDEAGAVETESGDTQNQDATYKPFADLKQMLKSGKD